MSLRSLAPNLDDRTFQDLVDEAKRLIPRYCPEWTDHNVSDPGVALIELFAWMTESMIFRLNRVPEKTHITFLDMIGTRLLPPRAAVADLTFRLPAPQPAPKRSPEGTEVETIRTPDWESVTFRTTSTLELEPPSLIALMTSANGQRYSDRRDRLVHEGVAFEAFEHSPNPENVLLFGFAGNLSRHLLRLRIQADQGTGPNPDDAPLDWEAWLGEDGGWQAVDVDMDTTMGLLQGGMVDLHVPDAIAGATWGERRARTWLRARILPNRPGQPPYDRSPRILSVEAETIGGTTSARHAERIRWEPLGFSDGKPGQEIRLSHAPVLPRGDGEFLEVGDEEGDWIPWDERPNFSESGPDDRHYTLDDATGVISFGPAIRSPDGMLRQHGQIPPEGAPLRFAQYHTGGGAIGNLGAQRLVILTSSLPYVAAVTNRAPAAGGADVESLDHAKLRAGARLRTRDRAVTATDFEVLATQASTAVARAKCLGPTDLPAGTGKSAPKQGTVVVVILPTTANTERAVEPDELKPPKELLDSVRAYLDERRLIGTIVDVRPARAIRVAVRASIVSLVPGRAEHAKQQVEQALYRLLNPWMFGPDEVGGWPFGRHLSIYDVHAAIQRVPGIELVSDVHLSVVDERERARDAGVRVAVPPDTLIASAAHAIQVEARRS